MALLVKQQQQQQYHHHHRHHQPLRQSKEHFGHVFLLSSASCPPEFV